MKKRKEMPNIGGSYTRVTLPNIFKKHYENKYSNNLLHTSNRKYILKTPSILIIIAFTFVF